MKKVFFYTGLSLLLLACSKDQRTTNGGEDASAFSANKSLPERNKVHILNSGFSPTSLKISADATVIWVNDDNKAHTVTSDKFDSGDIPPGGTFSYHFQFTGTFPYYCKYHGEKADVVAVGNQ